VNAEEAIEQLVADRSLKRIMVIGASDAGKTTFAELLLRRMEGESALVDLDLGQSHVGPPAMLGWGRWSQEYRSVDEIRPERLFFVGATSPLANPKAAIAGAAALVSDASDRAERVVIDTSGAVEGSYARHLKLEKIRVTRTDGVVALERGGELEHITNAILHGRLAPVLVLPVAKEAVPKPARERSAYRHRRFAGYFASACLMRLPLEGLEMMAFSKQDSLFEGGRLIRGLLIGLADRVGRHVGMGIIEGLDEEANELIVLTPVPRRGKIVAVLPGRMLLTPAGKEERLRRR